MSQNNKKTNITLSFDSTLLEELKKEINGHGFSINSKINSILEKYLQFYRYAEKYESVVIPYKQIIKMIDLMDENALTEIMKVDGNANILSVLHRNGIPLTMDSLIKYCFDGSILHSGAYSSFCQNIDSEGYLCLVFEHKFGPKWSRVLASAMSNLIESAVHYPVKSTILPYTIVLRVPNRNGSHK